MHAGRPESHVSAKECADKAERSPLAETPLSNKAREQMQAVGLREDQEAAPCKIL